MQKYQDQIRQIALEIGFNEVSFVDASPLLESEQHFLKWREQGFAADMNYLLKDDPINARPQELIKEAKSLIMLTANYYSPCPPRPSAQHGRIAAYAVGLDYHKVLRKKIQELINHPDLVDLFAKSKFFTDSVPLLEKSFARKAGLGFRGKNTLLISRETGSFNFICEILTDLELSGHCEQREAIQCKDSANALDCFVRTGLPVTTRATQLLATLNPRNDIECAQCTRCIDICPTNALPDPYQLDSRKCISYHTIENRGEIPEELAQNFGEWFFGCDLCQTICPYNRRHCEQGKAIQTFPEFKAESGFGHWIYLPEILDLELGAQPSPHALTKALESHKFIDPKALTTIKKYLAKKSELREEDLDHIFQIKFARTPLLRPKRLGLIRNAKIVLNNANQAVVS